MTRVLLPRRRAAAAGSPRLLAGGLALALLCGGAVPAAHAQATGNAAAEEPAAPEAPALAPPPAAVLAPRAAPAPPAAVTGGVAGSPLAGLESRSDGGWRVHFPNATAERPTGAAPAGLAELGRRLAALPAGRIVVIAHASGPANDASVARRRSLERGIAVKQALVAGGLAETRIDIRPMGRTAEAVDAVDVLPPAPPRAPAR